MSVNETTKDAIEIAYGEPHRPFCPCQGRLVNKPWLLTRSGAAMATCAQLVRRYRGVRGPRPGTLPTSARFVVVGKVSPRKPPTGAHHPALPHRASRGAAGDRRPCAPPENLVQGGWGGAKKARHLLGPGGPVSRPSPKPNAHGIPTPSWPVASSGPRMMLQQPSIALEHHHVPARIAEQPANGERRRERRVSRPFASVPRPQCGRRLVSRSILSSLSFRGAPQRPGRRRGATSFQSSVMLALLQEGRSTRRVSLWMRSAISLGARAERLVASAPRLRFMHLRVLVESLFTIRRVSVAGTISGGTCPAGAPHPLPADHLDSPARFRTQQWARRGSNGQPLGCALLD
jgi:hypothetical protein